MLVGPLVLKTLSGTISESDGVSLYALMHNLYISKYTSEGAVSPM